MKISVITPIGRESETLSDFIDDVHDEIGLNGIHYLITDDFTDAASFKEIKLLQTKYKNLVWHHLENNKKGISAVYLEGYKKALLGDADYFLEIDAGYSHNPRDISKFMELIPDYEVLFGNRFSGINQFQSTLKRRIISKGGSFLSRKISKTPFLDLTSGFQCFARNAIEQIIKDQLFAKGPFFQTEMKIRAHRSNFKIVEIPITYKNPDHQIRIKNVTESLIILFTKYRKL